ncbi:MAG TPA: hypothetical protein VGN52_04295 [Burkholderiales bacterium]|jgi:ribosomal protein L7/L12
MPNDTLPPEVIGALQRGDTIDAIRLLRDATGLGLKESKEMVDAYKAGRVIEVPLVRASGAALEGPATGTGFDSLPADALAALKRGRKIEAIKLTRIAGHLSLKEAKDRVEAYERGAGPPTTTVAGALGGLAPGEVPKTGGRMWIIVAVIAVAAAFWFFVMH